MVGLFVKSKPYLAQYSPPPYGRAIIIRAPFIPLYLASESRLTSPIEICPTSNMRTLVLKSLSEHPTLEMWLENNYPIVLCTDDKGVF